ncbi:hypothetical protein COS91_02755 [Candidatus Desantisbacteria bacterium CG07_land_8_20_14_0_80_39_15]|uniref:AbiEi antitoxin C-terminal domain-containing protein n=1 Tax=Candidatus Desantisbacteria bacterium CG07_land_8_20_14_0_80_39_15 TaxID=1974549 RepID=A0A2M6ZHA9_9BACT|nr:MAG: hypothetical protein COS91_02755 [Candidatus Desantisbacteria bacterium CG07_land_8_20_14_0_80_39_15]
MNTQENLLNNSPVFTSKEYQDEFKEINTKSTVRTKIGRLLKKGRMGTMGGGIYFVIPQGYDVKSYTPDKFLAASKMREDAVIGYHSAFELLGYATQVFNTVYYITSLQKQMKSFRGVTYLSVSVQRPLQGRASFGIEKIARDKVKVAVTNKERTLIDCLDRLEYSGGFEELCHCAEALPYLDLDFVFEYLSVLSKKSLFAKAGYLLEKYKDKFFFDEKWVKRFISERFKSPSIAYLGSRSDDNKLIARWNLMVPKKYLVESER